MPKTIGLIPRCKATPTVPLEYLTRLQCLVQCNSISENCDISLNIGSQYLCDTVKRSTNGSFSFVF